MADLVSVVIPVYNTNERFRACFESVLNQRYQNIEVLLVDDGSSDASAQICDIAAQSTNSFPVFVIHKTNGGVSRARNLGIEFANGKYIVFIDSDDIVTPDYVSDFMKAREKYPDVGHIWCGFEHRSQISTGYIYSENEKESIVSRDDYYYLAGKVLTQSPCMRLYDVSILRQNHIRMNEGLSLAEDVLFNFEYMDTVPLNKICIVNASNYIYVDVDSDSLKNKYRKDLKEIYDILLGALWRYTKKWELTDDSYSITEYYNTVYYRCVELLNNTFHHQNRMSYVDKLRFNNDILRSKRFIDALSLMSITIPNWLKRAYQTRNYFWVRVYERLASVRGWLHDKNKRRS